MPINIKSSKIREYHNNLVRHGDIIECSKQIKKFTGAIMERKKMDAQEYEYTNGKYSILMPKDAAEIIQEGGKLQPPLITIEEREGRIRQCCGFRNSYNHNAEIRDFIIDYAMTHNFRIDAVIFTNE